MKRLFLSFALALSAILLCVLPVMAGGFYTGTVNTLPATNIGQHTVTLNGSATISGIGSNSNGSLLLVTSTFGYTYFQYGTSSGTYKSNTPQINITNVGIDEVFNFSSDVTGLISCKKYYARAVVAYRQPAEYKKQATDYLISFLSPGSHGAGMYGLGTGMGFTPAGKQFNGAYTIAVAYGNEITFTTTGCQISTGPLGQGGSANAGAPAVTTTGPVQMSNIIVQSAALAATKVAPGEKVDVTASVTNKGSANGDAKVTLYVNGQEIESQGITVASGQTSPVHFSLSMNEPGTYTVSVGNVPAGSFTVDAFANNDFLIYGLIALFTIGIGIVIYMVTRKRTA